MKKILVLLLLVVFVCTPMRAEITEQAYTPEELLQMWQQLISMMREAECYPYVELRQGDTGYEVMFLQARLMQLNYYGKPIAPQFGGGTHAAMRMFEKVHKLPTNGIASVSDQKLLFSSLAKTNPGTAVGVEPGHTIPPDAGKWPDDLPPGWWPMPTAQPLTTPQSSVTATPGLGEPADTGNAPNPATATPHIKAVPDVQLPDPATPTPTIKLVPNVELPDFSFPTTPPPGPTVQINPDFQAPVVKIPGFDLPSQLDPGKLTSEPPLQKPVIEIPHF